MASIKATVLTIEESIAGLVIGRGGGTINHIETYSGAMVRVTDGETFDTCKVVVMGTERSQKIAVDMIRNLGQRKVLSVETGPAQQLWLRGQRRPNKRHDLSMPPPSSQVDPKKCEAENAAEMNHNKLNVLPAVVKSCYGEHDEVKAMSAERADAIRLAKNRITVKYVQADSSRPIPKPIETFKHAFHQYPQIMKVIEQQQFTHPTSIQCQAWPIIMSGHDLIAVAQAGTGKTLMYILPALIHLICQPTPRRDRIGPTVVILGPTAEIVLQIEREIKKYLFDGISVLSIYGGVPIQPQMTSLLHEKPEIVVATPGRLNDLVGVMAAKLNHVSYLVLDEADRMLNMGLITQIELALRHVRLDKQTIFTCTTWPKSVQDMAGYFTADPLHITIGSFDLTTVNAVEQKVIVLDEHQKVLWLQEFLTNRLSKDDKALIFMHPNADVSTFHKMIRGLRIKCRYIHAGRTQRDCESILSEFRNNVVPVLIATDVESRGLDMDNLTLVINYDFPLDIEEYVHRLGKTGRAGKSCSVISLFTYKDRMHAPSLISILENSKQPVPIVLLTMIDN